MLVFLIDLLSGVTVEQDGIHKVGQARQGRLLKWRLPREVRACSEILMQIFRSNMQVASLRSTYLWQIIDHLLHSPLFFHFLLRLSSSLNLLLDRLRPLLFETLTSVLFPLRPLRLAFSQRADYVVADIARFLFVCRLLSDRLLIAVAFEEL